MGHVFNSSFLVIMEFAWEYLLGNGVMRQRVLVLRICYSVKNIGAGNTNNRIIL